MRVEARGRALPGLQLGDRPPQLIAGLLLIGIAWPVAWAGLAPYSEHTFFPLWLGYILTVDGLVQRRAGTSLLTRSPRRFALLFAFSIPLWWLFEGANSFIDNWRYRLPQPYDPVTYAALASLSFSTVMPAIFETAELYRTFALFARQRSWVRIAPPRAGLAVIATLGMLAFIASLVFPRQGFPLVWLGLFFFLDPLNALLGAGSLAAQVARRRWDTVWVLFAAGLTCGFFWEMWNWQSLPKWVYDVPYVGAPKLFEMPLLGYGGYFPFALEVYAVYQLLQWILFRRPDTYLQFDAGLDDPDPLPAQRTQRAR